MAEITQDKVIEIFRLNDKNHKNDFSLPIRREEGDFYRELYLLFKEYQSSIEEFLKGEEYKQVQDDIKKICRWICLSVSETFRGNPYNAYDAIEKVMDLLVQNYPCFIGEEDFKNRSLYRVVDAGDKAKQNRKRVFHVPFNLRSKMSTTRYSIPGYPSLYLGNSLELNCAEIHKSPRDDTVIAARYEFCGDEYWKSGLEGQFQRELCIIDLSVKPQAFQNRQSSIPISGFAKCPEFYLLWYPLIASCSYIRINRSDPYAAEYIVPQLVMQWAKKTEIKDIVPLKFQSDRKILLGICYFSCLSEKYSEMGLNFAFPSSGSDTWISDDLKHFCPILAANFKLTEPLFLSEYDNLGDCVKDFNNLEAEQIGEFTNKIEKEIDTEGKYEIPDGEDSIPALTFYQCDKLKKIIIHDSVTSIGDCAFFGCAGLESINIPDSVTSIGGMAFYGCTGLTSITIPDSVMSIDIGIVSYCSNLCEITVREGNTKYYGKNNCIIENTGKLISGCMKSTIPDDGKVTSIGDGAFSDCTGLTSIKIPNSVMSIGDWAFSGCTGLTSITIPDSVTSIGDWAFDGCTGLTSITIPNGVTSIGDFTFYDCTKLTSITILNGVTSIGYFAFDGCTGLKSIKIPDSVTSIGESAFSHCTGLESITIPDSVMSIGDWAFQGCNNLNIRVPGRFKNKCASSTFLHCKCVEYYD